MQVDNNGQEDDKDYVKDEEKDDIKRKPLS